MTAADTTTSCPSLTLLIAIHPWPMGILIPLFYTGRWLKSLPVSSLLYQLIHRALHQRITKHHFKAIPRKSPLAKALGSLIYLHFLPVLWTYLKLLLIFLICKPSLRQTHQAGPVRGADLVPRGYDLRYMQICFGSTWALLSSKWLKANENWPEHGYTVLERNPNGWDGYLRQLCLIFNFTGGILSRAECKPLRNIIFLYLMQRCDILAARWEHLLCQSKGQNECQPGRLRQARPEGGSHDDAPQSPSQLCQISSDLQLG